MGGFTVHQWQDRIGSEAHTHLLVVQALSTYVFDNSLFTPTELSNYIYMYMCIEPYLHVHVCVHTYCYMIGNFCVHAFMSYVCFHSCNLWL